MDDVQISSTFSHPTLILRLRAYMDLGILRSFHLGNDIYHAIASHAFNFVGFVERDVHFEHWN